MDASVALKWFLPEEPDADRALSILRDGGALIAPDLLVAEVCNAAWRCARIGLISQAQVVEIAAVLPNYFDAFISSARLAHQAVEIAGQLDHSVYDCLYLALADNEQTLLVTADTRLVSKVLATSWERLAIKLAEYDFGARQ